ncbi:MAG TPA: lectin [Luteimonas sp.]|nr:lectin [Luteimonas sp.]
MKRSLFVPGLLVLALSACDAERKPQSDAAPAQQQAPELDQPAEDVPPATAPPATAMPAPVPGTYEGYGQARFGMSVEQVKRGWDGELEGKSDDPNACYYLRPKQTDGAGWPALMFENGKFVRYDVETVADVAPGGGQVGMSIDDIKTAYAGRVEERPDKYVEGGKNLRIKSNDGASAIVFETDVAGKITSWHVGVPPQVDYVEGCS